MVSDTTPTPTQCDLVYESHLIEDLQAYVEAVLLLLGDERSKTFCISPAVRCLLQGCDEIATTLNDNPTSSACSPIDKCSIASKATSAYQLAENEWDNNASWMTPVQHLYISLNKELTTTLHIFQQEIQQGDTKSK